MRTLVALLAMSAGSPVSTDVLLDELYGGSGLHNARNALQANIARLRRVLSTLDEGGAALITAVPGGYQLNVERGSVDALKFLSLVKEADRLDRADVVNVATLLKEALELWRGPALMDVSGGSAIRVDRIRLTETRLHAMELLVEARLAMGESSAVVSDLKRLVEIHPERERFGELLMLALYRTGRQSEALAVFARARHYLKVELGISPGHELDRMHQAILSQDTRLDLNGLPRRLLV